MADKLFQPHALGHDGVGGGGGLGGGIQRKKIQKDKDCKVNYTSNTNSSGILQYWLW